MVLRGWAWPVGVLALPATAWCARWAIAIAFVPLCDGWNPSSAGFTRCRVAGVEDLASDGWGIVVISSMTFGLPLFGLAAVATACATYWLTLARSKPKSWFSTVAAAGALVAGISVLTFVAPFIVMLIYIAWKLVTLALSIAAS